MYNFEDKKYSKNDLIKMYLNKSRHTATDQQLFKEIVSNKQEFSYKHFKEISKVTGLIIEELQADKDFSIDIEKIPKEIMDIIVKNNQKGIIKVIYK